MTLRSIMIDDIAIWFADDKPGLGWWHSAAIREGSHGASMGKAGSVETDGILAIRCGCELAPHPEHIATVSDTFARAMGQSPDDVILSEVNLAFREARIELVNEKVEANVVARSARSGSFPFSVELAANLSGDPAKRLRAALGGEQGSGLRLVYDLEVRLPFKMSDDPHVSVRNAGAIPLAIFGDFSEPPPGLNASYLASGLQSYPIAVTADVGGWFGGTTL